MPGGARRGPCQWGAKKGLSPSFSGKCTHAEVPEPEEIGKKEAAALFVYKKCQVVY
jgi:hypothetical protein